MGQKRRVIGSREACLSHLAGGIRGKVRKLGANQLLCLDVTLAGLEG